MGISPPGSLGKGRRGGPQRSDQAEALVLLHGLREAVAQRLFGAVAGHVQQVVAGVRHRQVVLLGRGGLDDDVQAGHAVDGNAVAACQEHCGGREIREQRDSFNPSYVCLT